MTPQAKGRLSAPSSRGRAGRATVPPAPELRALPACRARMGDEQVGRYTWSRQRRPTCPAPPKGRLVSQAGPRRTAPRCRQPLGTPCAAQKRVRGGHRFSSEACLHPPSGPVCAGSGAGFQPGWASARAGATGTTSERKGVRLHGAAPRSRPLTPDPRPTFHVGRARRLTRACKPFHGKGRKPPALVHQTISSTKVNNYALNVLFSSLQKCLQIWNLSPFAPTHTQDKRNGKRRWDDCSKPPRAGLAGHVCVYINTGVYVGRGVYLVWCFSEFFFSLPVNIVLAKTPFPTTTQEQLLQNGFQNVLDCFG